MNELHPKNNEAAQRVTGLPVFPFNRQLTSEALEKIKEAEFMLGFMAGTALGISLAVALLLLTSCGPMYPSQPKPCTWYRPPGTNHCYGDTVKKSML